MLTEFVRIKKRATLVKRQTRTSSHHKESRRDWKTLRFSQFRLIRRCRDFMDSESNHAKPDDLTLIMFRGGRWIHGHGRHETLGWLFGHQQAF